MASVRLGFFLLAVCFFFPCPAAAQELKTPAQHPPVDIDDLIAECQQVVRGDKYTGFIWWIPVVFWEESARSEGVPAEQAREQFKSLQDYTAFGMVVGRIGALGGITFVSGDELRANVVLRDAAGREYASLEEVSSDANMLALMLRPILSQAIGRTGENLEIFFFPATDPDGSPIADPRKPGRFALVVKKVAGGEEQVFEWKLPLTSLTPPRFCPTGGERMQASWQFCPWHGTKLE